MKLRKGDYLLYLFEDGTNSLLKVESGYKKNKYWGKTFLSTVLNSTEETDIKRIGKKNHLAIHPCEINRFSHIKEIIKIKNKDELFGLLI